MGKGEDMAERSVSFGEVLRRFREMAGLSQRTLASRAGLSEEFVSSLERGKRKPRVESARRLAQALRVGDRERGALFAAAGLGTSLLPPEATSLTILEGKPNAAALLAEARALIETLPTDHLPPYAPSLPPGSRMRLGLNPFFVGRGDELLRVASALKGADTTIALGQLVASTGLGGLGKTQLAVEFVHRYGHFFAGGVFWLSFARPEDVPLQVASCAGPAFEARPVEERLELVRRAWESALPRLLVFDNCEEEALLDAWRPPSGGCRVLVTSRRAYWSPTLGVAALPLDLLPRPDSIELVRRYRPDLAPDDPSLDALAHELGDLPLALHLAGSYLRTYHAEVSLDDYLAELRRSEVVQHASLLGAGLEDAPSPTRHVQGVAQTFALCLGRLDREREADRVAIALLARMGSLAPGELVTRDLLDKTLEDPDPLLRADGLRRLGAVGLVEEGEGWLRLHRLLAHFVRQESLDPDAQPAVDSALIGYGNDAADGHLTGPTLAAAIPHFLEVAERAAAIGNARSQRREVELSNASGQALRRAGDLTGARSWHERAVTICETTFQPDDPSTATSLNSLAGVLHDMGELAAARQNFERALTIRERALGLDDSDTGGTLNDLAGVLHDQGELVAARRLFERALAISEKVLGSDASVTAGVLNNLARLIGAQGDLAAARLLYERALAIWGRQLRPDHPYIATCRNNLAGLLMTHGDLDAAKPLLESALTVCEEVLGPDHPDTARGLNNLAHLLLAQGDADAARPLLERAVMICERVFGAHHPNTAVVRRNLARLNGEPSIG